MLVRLWETGFDTARAAELVAYATDVSGPVLTSRPGCCGALFFSRGDRWITQTIWRDQASVDALDTDPGYNLRDLALFYLAIDSKLRGCDLVRLCACAANDLKGWRPSIAPRMAAMGKTRCIAACKWLSLSS